MAEHRPFVFRISKKTRGGYPVAAEFDGHISQGVIPPTLPLLDRDELRQAHAWLSRSLLDTPYARELGDRLFRTLFNGPIEGFFRQAYERAGASGLRVVLSWPLPEALDALPWELLYDRSGGLGYLIQSQAAPFVRLHGLTLPNPPPERAPFRVLIAWASPPGHPPLDGDLEKKLAALAARGPLGLPPSRDLAFTVLPHATRAALVDAVRAAAARDESFHAVQFIGHVDAIPGATPVEDAGPSPAPLRFALDGEAGPDPASADDLAALVASPALNLALLTPLDAAPEHRLLADAGRPFLAAGAASVVAFSAPGARAALGDFGLAFFRDYARGLPAESAVQTALAAAGKTSGGLSGWSAPVTLAGSAAHIPFKLARSGIRPDPVVRPVRLGWKAFGLALTALGIVGTLLGVPDLALQVRTRVPVVKCYWPAPMESGAARFNVVMTPFTHLDEQGRTVRDGAGAELSQQLFRLLQTNLNGLDVEEEVALRGPGETCAIPGATAEQREEAAAQLAERIGANVIVYGVIRQQDGEALFAPEFRVSYRGFEDAIELVGPHELGAPVNVELPVTDDQFQGDRHPLGPRTRALSLVALGLAYQSAERIDEAQARFEAALETPAWLDEDGKSVAWLLLGNSHLRQVERELSGEHLAAAESAFETSREIDATSARAAVGLSNTLYLRALGNLDERLVDNIDLGLLARAEATARSALTMPAPASANIRAKVNFMLGQIAMARYYRTDAGWLDRAEEHYRGVVDEYAAGNTGLGRLAAVAYAALADVAAVRGDSDAAVALYLQATDEAEPSPTLKARFYLMAGDLRAAEDQIDAARELYERALAVGREASDQAIVDESQAAVESLAAP